MAKKNSKELVQESISRAKYRCPDELEEMIKLCRLLPPEIHLPPLMELFRSEIYEEIEQNPGGIFHFLFHGRNEVYLEKVLRKMYPQSSPLSFLEKYIEKTPTEFKNFLMPIKPIEFKDPFFDQMRVFTDENKDELEETYTFIQMMCKYTDFYQTRHSLQIFVNCIEREVIRPRTPPNSSPEHFSFELPVNLIIRRESDGMLHLTGLARLIEEGFEDSRLRKCKKCKHIYWAKRIESKTCSKKCLNAYNVQEYRKLSDEDKAKKKLQRATNRALIRDESKNVRVSKRK